MELFRSVERKWSITAVWLDAKIQLARRKALVFIVFLLVIKIGVRNGVTNVHADAYCIHCFETVTTCSQGKQSGSRGNNLEDEVN